MAKKAEFYPKLKGLIDEHGDWNINYSEIARKWQLPIRTVHNWRNKILLEMEQIQPAETGKHLIRALYSAAKQCQLRIYESKLDSDKIRYMLALCKIAQTLTDLLEAYGVKKINETNIAFSPVAFIQTIVELNETKAELERLKATLNAR